MQGWGLWVRPWPGQSGVGTHLPELGHGLTGDDLIVVQPRDKAERLKLTLPLLQLPQDQGSEDLHVLKGKGRSMEISWRVGLQFSPGHCTSASLEDTSFPT